LLPIQLDAALEVSNQVETQFRLLRAPGISEDELRSVYDKWAARRGCRLQVSIQEGEIRQALRDVCCAIVKSGTSTLEATVLQVPFAMVYRISQLSWYMARPFVKTRTYCLANLIAGRQIVPEFVQKGATGERIGAYIIRLLRDRDHRETVRQSLGIAAEKLGKGNAYQEAARCWTNMWSEARGSI